MKKGNIERVCSSHLVYNTREMFLSLRSIDLEQHPQDYRAINSGVFAIKK